jgi:predicted nucleic acid-binding protein/predicted DNA-binding protein
MVGVGQSPIDLDVDLRRRLQVLSRRSGHPLAGLIRQALTEFLAEHEEFRLPAWVGSITDGPAPDPSTVRDERRPFRGRAPEPGFRRWRGVITLDASAVVALVSTRDRRHETARTIVIERSMETVVPTGILSEIADVVGARAGERGVTSFLRGVIRGTTYLDCGDADLPRVLELMGRFQDVGFADATVIACAERNGGQVLSFDPGGLRAVAREVPITLLP